jgi:hypothetical protein
MRKKTCHREEEVQTGLNSGKLSQELQNHIPDCPVCQDIALVQGWMNRFKERAWETDMPEKILPHAASIWNRVYAGKSIDKKLVRKALRPLIIPQVLSFGVSVAGIIYLTVWGFKKFGYILDNPIVSQIVPIFGILMASGFFFFAFCALIAAFDKRKHPI